MSKPKNTPRSIIKIKDYNFSKDDLAVYKGKLYEDYRGKIAKVTSRSRQKGKNYYTVEFKDGKILTIQETLLEMVPMEGQLDLFS